VRSLSMVQRRDKVYSLVKVIALKVSILAMVAID
jgi:hypothetical protein